MDFAGSSKLSREERFVILAIFVIAMLIFGPSLVYLPTSLMVWIDISKGASILLTTVAILPLSYFVGRRLTARIWPDVTKTADENASARINHREPI